MKNKTPLIPSLIIVNLLFVLIVYAYARFLHPFGFHWFGWAALLNLFVIGDAKNSRFIKRLVYILCPLYFFVTVFLM